MSSVTASGTVTESAESSTAPVASAITAATSASEDHKSESSPDFKCEQCDYTNNTIKGTGQHVRMKHRISQVDGVMDSDDESIPVNISEVTKTFEISVDKLVREDVCNELDRIWDGNNITGVDVKQELENFSVRVSCSEFDEDFNVSSAASLIESLTWPETFTITNSQPTRYFEKNTFYQTL